MNITEILNNNKSDWIFNSLGIENFNETSKSRLRHWFQHLENNHKTIEGDIFEFGVYKGGGAIAMGLLLNILGSDKIIYAFDSFSGFPSYHENDDLDVFENNVNIFSNKHIEDAILCRKIAEWRIDTQVTPENISTSGNFSDVSKKQLELKIEKFGLNNIKLIEGDFKDTVPDFFKTYKGSIFSVNIDCDLYEGYRIALENIYDKTNSGGLIYLDEYYSLKFPGARIAVEEFLENKNEKPTMISKDQNDFERWGIIKL